jgi:hypothetical protein
MPQVPPVPALDRVRQRGADSFAVGTGPVAGDDLGARVSAEPLLDDVSGAPFQDIDALAGLGVDQDGRVDPALPQREVIDAQHAGHLQGGEGNREQDPQGGMPRDGDPECRQQPGPGAAR